MKRIISWYSCGAASAVATKLALDDYRSSNTDDEFKIVYIYLQNEHADSMRFLKECERWLDFKIDIVRDTKYNADVDEVIAKTRYMSGIYGATCTKVLKRDIRVKHAKPNDVNVFGMTSEEKNRIDRLIDAEPNVQFVAPLVDKGVTKKRCFEIIREAGIELPAMYKLGYNNNNCVGCLKASSPAYWNKIRRDFPNVFNRRAEQERLLGTALCKMSLNKFKTKYPVEHDKMKADSEQGKVRWVSDGKSVRIPLRYLPAGETKAKVSIGNCGFFCEAK